MISLSDCFLVTAYVSLWVQRHDYPWAKKMLGKFPLPPWQRDSVWTREQKVSFIKSVYLGYDLGSVVINGYLTIQNDKLAKFSDCLIDGQQRLGAILDYTDNEFSVYGLLWKELDRNEQNRFLIATIIGNFIPKKHLHFLVEKSLYGVITALTTLLRML